jgi:tetratricopeptide (TPR) repeat protein
MKPIKKKRNKMSTGKRLDNDLLDRIEYDIMSKNVRSLKRCASLDKIRFPKRMDQIEECLYIPDRNHIARHRLSISNLITFDKYKDKFNYDQSRWYTNTDDYYDNEREWVREIWNVWFDEVIPQLDGTGGRKSPDGKKASKQQAAGEKEEEEDEDEDDGASTAVDDQSTTHNNSKLNLSSSVSIRHLPTAKQLAGQIDSTEEQLQPVNVKSPTPYFLFDRIELDQTTDINALKTLEKEVEVLTKRIESKPSAFDFGRRGTLYRKLGFIKLALDDLNKAIEMEERYVDAYWQRHLIYLLQDYKDQALEDLNIILKINRTHSGAYLSR